VCFAKACRATDALDQAIWQRKTPANKDLVHHADCGSQYLSIKYTERLAEADIDLEVGTVGDAYDNALAECVIDLFKTEVINQIGPWKSMREVEWETLKWPYSPSRQIWPCQIHLPGNGCTHRLPACRSTGITTAAFSAPSDTSRPQKQRRHSMQT
jgi:transposase InsO family protein